MAPATWNSLPPTLPLRHRLRPPLPLPRNRDRLRSRIRPARNRPAVCHRTTLIRSRKLLLRLRNSQLSPIGERGRALPELKKPPEVWEAFLFIVSRWSLVVGLWPFAFFLGW